MMNQVDTVLFLKTGTLTRPRNQAYREHLGRPRGPDPKARPVARGRPLFARSFLPIRWITWQRSRRESARCALSATESTTRSPSRKRTWRSAPRASSIATDMAHVVFLEGGLSRLCDLRDIARDLDRNANRSWSMIVALNVTNVVGVFTMGFGIMTSVITNNVSSLFVLGSGLLPFRNIARANAERRRDRETEPSEPVRHDLVPMPPLAARRRVEADTDSHPVFTESA